MLKVCCGVSQLHYKRQCNQTKQTPPKQYSLFLFLLSPKAKKKVIVTCKCVVLAVLRCFFLSSHWPEAAQLWKSTHRSAPHQRFVYQVPVSIFFYYKPLSDHSCSSIISLRQSWFKRFLLVPTLQHYFLLSSPFPICISEVFSAVPDLKFGGCWKGGTKPQDFKLVELHHHWKRYTCKCILNKSNLLVNVSERKGFSNPQQSVVVWPSTREAVHHWIVSRTNFIRMRLLSYSLYQMQKRGNNVP